MKPGGVIPLPPGGTIVSWAGAVCRKRLRLRRNFFRPLLVGGGAGGQRTWGDRAVPITRTCQTPPSGRGARAKRRAGWGRLSLRPKIRTHPLPPPQGRGNCDGRRVRFIGTVPSRNVAQADTRVRPYKEFGRLSHSTNAGNHRNAGRRRRRPVRR